MAQDDELSYGFRARYSRPTVHPLQTLTMLELIAKRRRVDSGATSRLSHNSCPSSTFLAARRNTKRYHVCSNNAGRHGHDSSAYPNPGHMACSISRIRHVGDIQASTTYGLLLLDTYRSGNGGGHTKTYSHFTLTDWQITKMASDQYFRRTNDCLRTQSVLLQHEAKLRRPIGTGGTYTPEPGIYTI